MHNLTAGDRVYIRHEDGSYIVGTLTEWQTGDLFDDGPLAAIIVDGCDELTLIPRDKLRPAF